VAAEELSALPEAEIQRRIDSVRARMRPLEAELAELRGERDVLLTELRRRERMAHVHRRADLRARMKEGVFPSLAELIANTSEGAFDDFTYNLKTGGEVRLGFPGARRQTLHFTDGRQLAQAADYAQAAALFSAGWELGSPGRPGVRVHFPGTRQERLADPSEVFARPRSA
jgi:hypothetical protein